MQPSRTRRALILAVPMLPTLAYAQAQPARVIVPFPPGGPADVLARLLITGGLGDGYGRPVIVDNRPGAAGLLGTQAAARSPADGGTFLFTPSFFLPNAILYAKAGYDPFKDFEPVTAIAQAFSVFAVNAAHPARSIEELVRAARANPGRTSYASAGPGSNTHLFGHVLGQVAGVDITHVPFKGEAPALQDLLANQVSCGFFSLGSVRRHVESGKLRILGVARPTRAPALPDAPTIAEAGYKHPIFDILTWLGFFAPAGTSREAVNRMASAAGGALKRPEVTKPMGEFGLDVWGIGPEEFAGVLRRDFDVWKRVIEQANIKLEI